MTISRIHFPKVMQVGDRCGLTGENRRYALSVLRMKQGDKLLLFDGAGCEYEAVVKGQDPASVDLEIIAKTAIDCGAATFTLAQSLPKGKKMDVIIEKACELGANVIIPFVSERSIPHLTRDTSRSKQARWQKIAGEAARKSHAPAIPEVRMVLPFAEMLQAAGRDAMRIIFWEEEKGTNLQEVLRKEDDLPQRDFFIVVGPEGGFSAREIELAQSAGFTSVSLGRQILKVETASLAILSIMQYERGTFGSAKDGGISL